MREHSPAWEVARPPGYLPLLAGWSVKGKDGGAAQDRLLLGLQVREMTEARRKTDRPLLDGADIRFSTDLSDHVMPVLFITTVYVLAHAGPLYDHSGRAQGQARHLPFSLIPC